MTGSAPDLRRERIDYHEGTLTEADAGRDPHALFDRWMQDAITRRDEKDDLPEPNAMVVATADRATGQPHSRTVLLKGHEDGRFLFFTNYESAKGREIAENDRVAINFTWFPLQRQIRIEGTAAKLPGAESDAYHDVRPRGAQIGAWASPQSQTITDREELNRRNEEAAARFDGEDTVPRPPHWGGYAVTAHRFEFWQGGGDRLHDRLVFEPVGPDTDGASPASPSARSEWTVTRLAP
ncbi:pyridoxamine 5'-phosphate oxidase [Helcobacillus massiliensis]|uniref:Pyridoxine/pyridoxamine 5'-phosphate oxidase n=1 Tax=Helcobacillus massiliensis TaxID=521392 RepID=A0A839R076_9MICO|nr:pyridoxamine 5'-phosphate oxidase [Helcobacillus massiliensis]MBB3023631.1 pyridoxamine 5'-phosphate oxidase [Helcobacillus massiliensis]